MNLVQSPISTVSASPVSAEMPRRQPSRSGVGESLWRAPPTICLSRRSRAAVALRTASKWWSNAAATWVSSKRCRCSQALVQPGPGRSTRVDPALTQQQFGQPVTYPHQIRAQVRARCFVCVSHSVFIWVVWISVMDRHASAARTSGGCYERGGSAGEDCFRRCRFPVDSGMRVIHQAPG